MKRKVLESLLHDIPSFLQYFTFDDKLIKALGILLAFPIAIVSNLSGFQFMDNATRRVSGGKTGKAIEVSIFHRFSGKS